MKYQNPDNDGLVFTVTNGSCVVLERMVDLVCMSMNLGWDILDHVDMYCAITGDVISYMPGVVLMSVANSVLAPRYFLQWNSLSFFDVK